eukprot:1721160-Pleurochrysis_carterae.AAC.1
MSFNQRDKNFTLSASVVGGASYELEALRLQQQKDASYSPTSSSNQSTAFRKKRSTPDQHQLLVAPVMGWKRCWSEEQEQTSGVGTGRSGWHMRQFLLSSPHLLPNSACLGFPTPLSASWTSTPLGNFRRRSKLTSPWSVSFEPIEKLFVCEPVRHTAHQRPNQPPASPCERPPVRE